MGEGTNRSWGGLSGETRGRGRVRGHETDLEKQIRGLQRVITRTVRRTRFGKTSTRNSSRHRAVTGKGTVPVLKGVRELGGHNHTYIRTRRLVQE